MKQSIGFLSIEIRNDPQSKFITNYINGFADAFPHLDVILFNSVYDKPDETINAFSLIHINEAKFFKPPIIAFNLKNMLFLQHCICKKVFYSLQPEWLELSKNIHYADLKNLYETIPDVLLVPKPDIAELYELCWKKPIVAETNDYNKVVEHV